MAASVSIIIVNWNSWDLVLLCIEKLKNQSYKDFDIVLVDNASEIKPPNQILAQYQNLKLIQNVSNSGFAVANNQAFKLIESNWVVLLNPDAFPEPDWLERLVCAAESHPDFVMFASRQLMHSDQQLLDGDGDAYHLSGLIWRQGYGRAVQSSNPNEREIFSPCAAAAMYRLDVVKANEGFDEDFFCYVEDIDLAFRLRLKGYACLLVPDAVVSHMGAATSGSKTSTFAIYYGHRNMVWAFVKNMPGVLFWLLLPLHLLINLLSIAWFSYRGYAAIILKAKRDALLGLPMMWKKRKIIQSGRKISVFSIWKILNKSVFIR